MRPDFAVGEIFLVCAMIEKGAQKICGVWICRPGGVGSADAGLGKRAQRSFYGDVVEFEIFFARTFPVSNVGFIPYFPQPGLYFGVAVALAQMVNELENQFGPLLIILRRVGPSGVDFASPRKIVTIRFGMRGKRLGHESDFDQRLDSGGAKCVENLVENCPAIN